MELIVGIIKLIMVAVGAVFATAVAGLIGLSMLMIIGWFISLWEDRDGID